MGRAVPEVFVGAYGKHPGWNDHIDDLGLETELLVTVKRVLYLEGIGAAVDSGAWDKLGEDQRIEGFDHVMLGRGAGDVVLCRLWSSSDGKGRTKYPMVLTAHCRGTGMKWTIDEALPRLEETGRRCAATNSADAVRAVVDGVRGELRARAGALAGPEVDPPAPQALVTLAEQTELAGSTPSPGGRQGLYRILYQIQREMADYGPISLEGGSGSRSRIGDLQPRHIRVPSCGDQPGAVIAQWLGFLGWVLDPGVPMTAIVAVGRPWTDLIVGDFDGSQFFCLRAAGKAMPLASEIPYTLDPGFVATCEQQIADARAAASGQGASEPRVGRGLLGALAGVFAGRGKRK
jgi:hypothetical protein